MKSEKDYKFWFIVGSQHLYGEDSLLKVEQNAEEIVKRLNLSDPLSYPIEFKGVLTNAQEIKNTMLEANVDNTCAGIIAWMHTFSPGKMWIPGLSLLNKPLLHLHTQFHRDIPWESIDMDYMNLHQAAHGDREFGYVTAMLNKTRKIIVGNWQDASIQQHINTWMKIAITYSKCQNLKIARFGDNMRNVADTEGDKVAALRKFGWTINYFGIGDLVEKIQNVSNQEVQALLEEYKEVYQIGSTDLSSDHKMQAITYQARVELALKDFLKEGNYDAFTTNFEDLHGLKQLPGLAVQRLMASGYGFAAEGDWKTAALTYLLKSIAKNKSTSFIEFYTYHLDPTNELILGSHMLEVCPTISDGTPRIEVHPLNIGGREDPARLVFDGRAGKGVIVSLIEMNGTFRMLVNEIEAITPPSKTPKLPVAKVIWKSIPSFEKATEAWIYAGGSHHAVFSLSISKEDVFEFANMLNVDCIVIDEDLNIQDLRQRVKF